MTRKVVAVDAFAPFKDIVRKMQEFRVSAVPVVDEDGRIMGLVSEGDLILKEDPELEGGAHLFEGIHRRQDRTKAAGLIASQLMTVPVYTVTPDAGLGEAARLMHRKTVKRLPVVDEEGRVQGIVSRTDLLKVFLRDDAEIATEIREDVIRRTLWIEPDTIRVMVRDGVVTLEGQLERRSLIPLIERLVLGVEGVVAVKDKLSFLTDDSSRGGELPLPWTPLAPRVGP
ncbi:MAG TPA: CBS domain-containing protein [Actinomycetota bacterium]